MLDEELLAAWLRLTTVIDNQRLAVSCAADQPRLPFNEAVVCGLLYAAQASQADRRLVELRLLPGGLALYRESHRRSVSMAGRLIDEMGEERIRTLLPLLRQAAYIFETIQQEV